MHLFFGDQPQGLILSRSRCALVIGKNHLDLGPFHIGQARLFGQRQITQFGMRLVDDFKRCFNGRLCRRPRTRRIAAQGINGTDLDGVLRLDRPRSQSQRQSRQRHQFQTGFHQIILPEKVMPKSHHITFTCPDPLFSAMMTAAEDSLF